MKTADLRDQSAEQLKELASTLSRELFQTRMKNHTNRLTKTSDLAKTRKDIARVKTVLRQKDLGLEPVKKA
jgi:large subunit ribosomal protein L29